MRGCPCRRMPSLLKFICLLGLCILTIETFVARKDNYFILPYINYKTLNERNDITGQEGRNIKPIHSDQCETWDTINNTASPPATKYNLNPSKFIIPILYNGPTNQLLGFRQSAYVAVLLNRTLAMPTFRKHFTDLEAGQPIGIDASQRMNLSSIRALLPIVSSHKIREECGGKAGAVLLATTLDEWTFELIEKFENEFGIKLLRPKSFGKSNKVITLSVPAVRPQHGFKVDSDQMSVMKAYQHEAKCLVYAFPFREIALPYNEYDETMETPSNSNLQFESNLANSIFESTQPPDHVINAVDDFRSNVLTGSYVAIHWRFDRKDFYKFMCTVNGNKQAAKGAIHPSILKICDQVFSLSGKELAESIFKFIVTLRKLLKEDINAVYLAAPRKSIEGFLDDFEAEMERLGVVVYSSKTVIPFLHERRMTCGIADENFNDFLSLFEMEMSIRSKVFLRSALSSWSDNVIMSRKMSPEYSQLCKYDRQVTKDFVKKQ